MKDRLIAIIIRDKARLIQLVAGIVMGLIVAGLLKLGITLDAADTATVTVFVAMLVGWGIEIWTGEENAKGAGQVQRLLNSSPGKDIPVDQFMGPETVRRAEEVVDALYTSNLISATVKGKPSERK